MTIHWCGTGLSAIPGLRRLLDAGHDVAVWNRTPEKAREAVGDLTSNIHAFSIANLGQMLSPKDTCIWPFQLQQSLLKTSPTKRNIA